MAKSGGLSGLEELVYILACVLSFGTIWITRIVITKAISKAS
jgi:hypothetical protein